MLPFPNNNEAFMQQYLAARAQTSTGNSLTQGHRNPNGNYPPGPSLGNMHYNNMPPNVDSYHYENNLPESQNQAGSRYMYNYAPNHHAPNSSLVGNVNRGTVTNAPNNSNPKESAIYPYVLDLLVISKRTNALSELSKVREVYENLAVILWNSHGVMACLIQELLLVYPYLYPSTLSQEESGRLCNVLALLQVIASHNKTRHQFIKANIPVLLFPFLSAKSENKNFEHIRLTSLGVIGALVKYDDPSIIRFLISTEIIHLCLGIMQTSTELSKTVAIYIIHKLIADDEGLSYICGNIDRFMQLIDTLQIMVLHMLGKPPSRLIKHVVKVYARLAENPQAKQILCQRLPHQLRDSSFSQLTKDDVSTKKTLSELLSSLGLAVKPQQNA